MATYATYIAFVTSTLVFFITDSSQERSPYEGISKPAIQYTLPELGFNVGELEPYISQATIRAHHGGHHLAYTDKLNEVLRQWRLDVSLFSLQVVVFNCFTAMRKIKYYALIKSQQLIINK